MEAVAKLKNCPMSARKMRMVAHTIRNKDVDKALDILKYTQKEGGIWLEKLLLSAINNWEQKSKEVPDDYELYIKTLLVDEGQTLKRFRPVPYGRAHRIRKRTNHVTIVVDNKIAISADNQDLEDADYEGDDENIEE